MSRRSCIAAEIEIMPDPAEAPRRCAEWGWNDPKAAHSEITARHRRSVLDVVSKELA